MANKRMKVVAYLVFLFGAFPTFTSIWSIPFVLLAMVMEGQSSHPSLLHLTLVYLVPLVAALAITRGILKERIWAHYAGGVFVLGLAMFYVALFVNQVGPFCATGVCGEVKTLKANGSSVSLLTIPYFMFVSWLALSLFRTGARLVRRKSPTRYAPTLAQFEQNDVLAYIKEFFNFGRRIL